MEPVQQDSPLWAITCYFNPAGYHSRRANFLVFREHLPVPLVAVELSYTDTLELNPSEADLLIQLRGGDVLWQKERLLNIALEHLPDHCEFVMWLDCDLVFERQGFQKSVIAALQDNVLIQPFSMVFDLKMNVAATAPLGGNFDLKRVSMAAQISWGTINYDSCETDMLNHYSPGHTWAARRDSVEETGFYDAMILGSGDLAMAKAATGQIEDVVRSFCMNDSQEHHYRDWAKRWCQVIDGRIGVVEGTVRHLWHGSLENRGYPTRYASLRRFDFNPYEDIEIGEDGCWKWSSDKAEMHRFFREYFKSRKEDGEE